MLKLYNLQKQFIINHFQILDSPPYRVCYS